MLYVLLLAIAVVGGAIWYLNRSFDAKIADLRDGVLTADAPVAAIDLPPIVRDFALRNGGTIGGPRAIHLRHAATLATAQGRPPMAVSADQWLSTRTSQFVWRARGSMTGLPVTVIDSVVGGEGLLEARLLGAITVAQGSGPEFAKGELQRYLSELPLHPDAILNNTALRWQQLDADMVEVTATSRYGDASATLRFDAAGDIIALEAKDRPMTIGDRTVPTVWRGSFSRYSTIGSYRIPTHGEVGWLLPDGLFTYWKGDIVAYEPL